MRGRYYSQRDMRFMASINGEFMGDLVENLIQLFKISPDHTETNLYGEATAEKGKWYMPGIQISTLTEREEMSTEQNDFGPDRNQNHIFKLREKMCQLLNFYPETGDVILWNDRYYEIDNVVQEQLLGGQSDKSWAIICHAHYTKVTSLNLVDRNIS